MQLAVRLGIHTGLVVVGEVGGGTRQEQLALGETPNLAARLQGIAAPNTLVISATTFHLLGGFFACQPLGTPPLKGQAQPLAVYRVLYESMARSRLEAVGSTGWTPLVGREQEVTVLRERWAQVKDGRGQVVLLSGEAGIGKSRLVQVLQEHVAAEPQAWLTPCQCSPYHQNTALYPLIDLLERVALRFDREESPQQKVGKLEGFLVQYGLPLAEAVPLLAAVLSLPLPADYAPLAESSEQQKQRTLQTFLTILGRLAAQQPVLFVMEDLHWADPTTLELLSLFVDHGPTVRILALWTFRPDFTPALDGADASHPGHAAALAASRGDGDDQAGGTRQGAARRGRGAGGGQDRWGAPVCRRADQDGVRVRAPPGTGRPLRPHRSLAAAGDSHHAARLADGALGSPGSGEGPGATRGHAGARVFLCLAPGCLSMGRGHLALGVAPIGGSRVAVPARSATAGDLPSLSMP